MPTRPEHEWVVAKNHHEAYVSREEFQKIQEILAAGRAAVRPPIGNGSGELQGLLWCGQCNARMNTLYWRHEAGHRSPSYSCRRMDENGKCLHRKQLLARLIDEAVREAVLSTLTPTTIEAALAAVQKELAATSDVLQTQRRQVQHAEDQVESARQRYLDADPSFKAVRAELASEWERAIHRRDELKRGLQAASGRQHRTIIRVTADELVALTRDIRMLWTAETTTSHDRKQLLQTVLSKVIVTGSSEEGVDLELVWSGGLRQPLRALRVKGIDSVVIQKRRDGKSCQDIADELNAAGYRDGYGRRFSASSIRQRIHTLGINMKVERQAMLSHLYQLLCKHAGADEILRELRARAPRAAPRTRNKLQLEILRLRHGVATIPALPPEAVAWVRSRNFWAATGS